MLQPLLQRLADVSRPCCPWRRPLWQCVMALIGISIQALVVSTVLPVTSHAIVQRQFAAALGQLADTAEETVSDLLPEEGSQGGSSTSEGQQQQQGPSQGGSSSRGGSRASGSAGSSPRGPPPAPAQPAGKEASDSHPSSPQATDGAPAPPSAFQQPAEEAPPSPPATLPETPPVRRTNRRRLALEQQSSLIALPPEPAAMGGGSRRTAAHALRQLRQPAGPELVEEAEPLLGTVYSRLLRRAWKVGCSGQPARTMPFPPAWSAGLPASADPCCMCSSSCLHRCRPTQPLPA